MPTLLIGSLDESLTTHKSCKLNFSMTYKKIHQLLNFRTEAQMNPKPEDSERGILIKEAGSSNTESQGELLNLK